MTKTTANLHSLKKSPSGDVALLFFQVDKSFTFQEGQFMMIECETPTGTQKKPYSIATTNTLLQDQGLIGFYIKQASDTGVSHYLTQIIKPGDQVSLRGPVGHYTDTGDHTRYLLISTGSGLSPNLGILEALLQSERDVQIVSLFGERSREKMIDLCSDLLTHDDDRLTSLITYSREGPVADYERAGYVQDHLDECLAVFGDTKHISVFLCGAPAMVAEVQTRLEDYGIQREDITTEKY